MVLSSKKIIGTLVPLSALSSLHSKKEDQDTFETGMAFLDWLHRTGQTAWQMLPLHQTQLEKDSAIKRVPSPYKGYGIGLDPKYLSSVNPKLEYRNSKQIQKTNDINIKRFENFDFEISKIASNFEFRASDLEKFIHENKDWIYDYALFCALTDHFGTDDWRRWETDLRDREKAALNKFSKLFRREIDQHVLLQYQLHKEYEKLRDKAKKLNIKLIGDLPYYLSINSPLVWAHQNIFQLKRGGEMEFVSGLPDGPAAHFGRQVWGHPLYKWGGAIQNENVEAFWKIRLKYLSTIFDFIRFDHAKGLFLYGVINPANDKGDTYEKGPGSGMLERLVRYSNECGLELFAEDSGDRVQELRDTLAKLKIRGIKIFRFSTDSKKASLHTQYANTSLYPVQTVAYTTTHDTETIVGYLEILTAEQKRTLSEVSNVKYDPENKIFAKRIRDALINSPADMVIFPIQDWLLTTERINIPGTEKEIGDPNWKYKLITPVENLPGI